MLGLPFRSLIRRLRLEAAITARVKERERVIKSFERGFRSEDEVSRMLPKIDAELARSKGELARVRPEKPPSSREIATLFAPCLGEGLLDRGSAGDPLVDGFRSPDRERSGTRITGINLLVYAKPRVIACGEDFADHVALPRGCLPEVIALLEAHGTRPEVRDERFAGTPIEVEFQGELRPLQLEAISRVTQYDEGILCAPTAFGETAVACWLIAKRKVNTLVMVHRQQLLDQWQERLAMFLNLPAKAIGQIDGGKMEPDWKRGYCGSFRACIAKKR
jgi:hypothetical protein